MSELKTLLQQFLFPPFSASSLPQITDWDTLSKMWKNAEGDLQESMIEMQMEKSLPAILSTLSDWPAWTTLLDMRSNAPAGSAVEKMIGFRMDILLPELLMEVSHWEALVYIQEDILPDSVQEQFVVRRMEEVLRVVLPKTKNWNTLVEMWNNAPPETPPELLIEQRMAEVVVSVSAKNVPEWFRDYLVAPSSIPFHLCKYISFKARELSIQL